MALRRARVKALPNLLPRTACRPIAAQTSSSTSEGGDGKPVPEAVETVASPLAVSCNPEPATSDSTSLSAADGHSDLKDQSSRQAESSPSDCDRSVADAGGDRVVESGDSQCLVKPCVPAATEPSTATSRVPPSLQRYRRARPRLDVGRRTSLTPSIDGNVDASPRLKKDSDISTLAETERVSGSPLSPSAASEAVRPVNSSKTSPDLSETQRPEALLPSVMPPSSDKHTDGDSPLEVSPVSHPGDVDASSTAAPVTAASTADPVTAASTAAPVTAASTAAPVTAASTAAPVTAASTAAPVTAASTAAPVAAANTAAPVTAASTADPVTAASTAAPVTAASTAAPVTAADTAAPVTAASTAAPVTAASTAAPVAAANTAASVTVADTAAPVTAADTAAPVTAASTAAPVTAASTAAAVTAADTAAPVTAADTSAPVTAASTAAPITAADTAAPFTAATSSSTEAGGCGPAAPSGAGAAAAPGALRKRFRRPVPKLNQQRPVSAAAASRSSTPAAAAKTDVDCPTQSVSGETPPAVSSVELTGASCAADQESGSGGMAPTSASTCPDDGHTAAAAAPSVDRQSLDDSCMPLKKRHRGAALSADAGGDVAADGSAMAGADDRALVPFSPPVLAVSDSVQRAGVESVVCEALKPAPQIAEGEFKEPLAPAEELKMQLKKELSDVELYLKTRHTVPSDRRKMIANARVNELKDILERVDQGMPIRSKMMMKDLILWNPNSQRMSSSAKQERKRTVSVRSSAETVDDPTSEESAVVARPVEQSPARSDPEDRWKGLETDLIDDDDDPLPVPQIKVGADGSIIVDETSLVVKSSEQKRRAEEISNEPVLEDNFDFRVSFNGYKRRRVTSEWSVKETARFYKALSTVGTDFSLMQQVFPRRSRADLKRKYKREDRANPHLTSKAMFADMQFDLSVFDDNWDDEVARCKQEKKRIKEELKKTKREEKAKDTQARRAEKKLLKKPRKPRAIKHDVPLDADSAVEPEKLLGELATGRAPGSVPRARRAVRPRPPARTPAVPAVTDTAGSATSSLFDLHNPLGGAIFKQENVSIGAGKGQSGSQPAAVRQIPVHGLDVSAALLGGAVTPAAAAPVQAASAHVQQAVMESLQLPAGVSASDLLIVASPSSERPGAQVLHVYLVKPGSGATGAVDGSGQPQLVSAISGQPQLVSGHPQYSGGAGAGAVEEEDVDDPAVEESILPHDDGVADGSEVMETGHDLIVEHVDLDIVYEQTAS